MRKDCLIVARVLSLALLCQLVVTSTEAKSGEDHWVWRTYSRRERAFRDKDIDRSASIRNSYDNKLRREPTTRRPLPGEPENDEIEDYVDAEPAVASTPSVGTRQFNPYGGVGNSYGGITGQPTAGGQFAGPVGYGGGGGSPGVLVGPGGPTGIIGRQPFPYPVYQPGFGGVGGGFPGYFGNAGLGGSAGYPQVGAGGNFAGFNGAQPGAGLGLGQFPGASTGQYPFAGYPGAGTDFNSNQFAAPGAQQYPGLGQYPSNQYGGPQYTEGYGLAGLNLGQPGAGLGPTGYGGNYGTGGGLGGGGFGFDEKSPALAEGKSAKSLAITPASSVNDKLSKKV